MKAEEISEGKPVETSSFPPAAAGPSSSSFILHPSSFLADLPWPAYEPALLIEDEVEIVLQVNGKVRDKIVVKKDATKEEIEAGARASAKIAEWTAGKEIRKVVVVPGKLVNIVVG